MSDGCWVQFWDDDGCRGATLRFDGPISVNDLDHYVQSDGRKEGDEPDSLKTGSRTWIVVYDDDNYGGRSASFGPNTIVEDLDNYGMGGNISSFKMFDYRPSWFVDSTRGNPTAIESNNSLVSAQTVNNYFRTMVSAGLNLIPDVGGALGTIVGGLWPDVDNEEQVWACYQNYLNQAIAGVYWQIEYQELTATLNALYRAAKRYVDVPVEDQTAKAAEFQHFYNLANDDHSYFVDVATPERKIGFLVPYATLRLAALRENLQHYPYYHGGQEPSAPYRQQLINEIRSLIAQYQGLLVTARDRVLAARVNLISVQEPSRNLYQVVDFFDGWTGEKSNETIAGYHMQQRKDEIRNQLALRLAIHDATGQLWSYFDPENTAPVEPPVIEYAVGPFGDYQGATPFEELAGAGQVSAMRMWSGSLIDALELWVDGASKGKVGGTGGSMLQLELTGGETISAAKGYQTGLINQLQIITSTGRSMTGGIDGGIATHRFDVQPLPDSAWTALSGISGEAKSGSASTANIKALTFEWRAALSIEAPAKRSARSS